MLIYGIDPGKKGAIAVLDMEYGYAAYARWTSMPLIESARGRDEYNEEAIYAFLLERKFAGPGQVLAFLEKLDAMPAFLIGRRGPKGQPGEAAAAGGSIANYQRGAAVYLFRGMLTALRIPYELVAPRTWQREMHQGTGGADTKQRSVQAAQRLFPGVNLLRTPKSRKLDDGIADALLMAEYGRRRYRGQLQHGVVAAQTS